jgi:hypothetical protein
LPDGSNRPVPTRRAVLGHDDIGAGVEGLETGFQRRQRRPAAGKEVGLRDDDLLRDGGLAHRLLVHVEGRGPVHGVDDGDDAFEGVPQREIGVVEHGVQDGRRVGKPRGLDDHAPERGDAAVVAPAQEVLEGRDEVAAHGAAQAPGGQKNHAVLDGLDKEVVEADLAELVDDHDRVGERRVTQESVQERRLAGAQKARQHRERDRREGAAGLGHLG